MHLSIKKIDQIAIRQFNLAYLSTDELLDIQNEVMNCYKLKMHQEFARDNFGLQFYINNVLTGLKYMIPLSVITSVFMITVFNVGPTIMFSNILSALGGLVGGTALFGFGNNIYYRQKEKNIIFNKLYEVLATIDYKNYQQQLITYSKNI
jgi:hypothetical protein